MNADKIKQLRELLAKATPGPWEHNDFEVYPSEAYGSCDGGCDEEGPFTCGRITHETQVVSETFGLREFASVDAQLIATAINELPGLLDELEYYRDKYPAALEQSIRDGLDREDDLAHELDRYKKALDLASSYMSKHLDSPREEIDTILYGASPNEEQD